MQRHALDPVSLAFGIIFTLLGGAFLFGDVNAATVSAAWAWAGVFAAIGVLLLAVGFRRFRR